MSSFNVHSLALISSTLLVATLAMAQPAPLTERSAVAPFAETPRELSAQLDLARTLPLAEPVTPFPMNLPDQVTDQELRGERGIGVALLVATAILSATAIGSLLYLFTFRSWRHS